MGHNISNGGIPIILVGRGAGVMISLVNAIKPDYDAIHTCLEVDIAIDEIPKILSNSEDILPASHIGTNINRDSCEKRPFPKAILIGGGVSQEDYEQMKGAVHDKFGSQTPNGLQWLKSTMDMYPEDLPPGEPPMELIIAIAKRLLDKAFEG